MKAEYRNWVPEGMIQGLAAGTAVLAVGTAVLEVGERKPISRVLGAVTFLGTVVCGAYTAWCKYASGQFSYDGQRQLSRQIVEGTAAYIQLPDEGIGLDVGCGSGALTIACAKRNPNAQMVGVDTWGPEYASFSQDLCARNAEAEGVASTTRFERGSAVKLPYPDETFDAVTSNYVYHNIAGKNKQKLLLETLRVLKKGGTFAIHDIMSPMRYGNMDQFEQQLRDMGYESVHRVRTDNGMFMSQREARKLMLSGSTLFYGRK